MAKLKLGAVADDKLVVELLLSVQRNLVPNDGQLVSVAFSTGDGAWRT